MLTILCSLSLLTVPEESDLTLILVPLWARRFCSSGLRILAFSLLCCALKEMCLRVVFWCLSHLESSELPGSVVHSDVSLGKFPGTISVTPSVPFSLLLPVFPSHAGHTFPGCPNTPGILFCFIPSLFSLLFCPQAQVSAVSWSWRVPLGSPVCCCVLPGACLFVHNDISMSRSFILVGSRV